MTVLALVVLGIFVLMILRVPVAFAFGIGAMAMMFFFDLGYDWVMIQSVSLVTSFPLLAIPLYIFLGQLMHTSGLVTRIIDFSDVLIGRVKGGLGYVVILGNGIFGAISGSAGAALVTFGTILYPRMRAQGYADGHSVALIASSAMLSLFIPPSMDMIMFGFMARLNIAACFLATVGPGILLMICYSVINFFVTRHMPLVQLPKQPLKQTMKDVWIQGRRAFFVVIVIPVIILGGIYGGIFTPTEAAGASVVVAILVGTLVHRSLTMKGLGKAMLESAYLTGMIIAVLFFLFVFGRALLWENIIQGMITFFTTVSKSIEVQLLLLNLVLLLIGMIIDDNSACILAGILLVPVMSKLGVNPYHLAGIVMANLGLGLLTPPVAPLLYAVAGVTGVPLKAYFKNSILFMVFANVPVIILTTYVPQVATYLPNLVFQTGLGTW